MTGFFLCGHDARREQWQFMALELSVNSSERVELNADPVVKWGQKASKTITYQKTVQEVTG